MSPIFTVCFLIFAAFIFAILSTLKKRVGKRIAKDNAAPDSTVDETQGKPPGPVDQNLIGCYFSFGALGPPRPYSKEDPILPEPHVSVVFACRSQDHPSTVSCVVRLDGLPDSMAEIVGPPELRTTDKSHLISMRDGEGIRITAQISMTEHTLLVEDLQEKINLYGSVAVHITYSLYLNGKEIKGEADTRMRWKPPTSDNEMDDDVGQYMAQYK